VVQLMEVIDRIPLPEHGDEDERIEWLIRRGAAIRNFNQEWRDQNLRKEANEEAKKQRKIFRKHCIAEAYDLHVYQRATYREILDLWRSKYADHEFYLALPRNDESLKKAVHRFIESLEIEGGT